MDHRFCIAPMMEWTDRHCRFFHRILTRRARLYTEMVTTGALIHGPRARLLAYSQDEHPVALQLGGSNPAELAACARMAEDAGFDEVNLNIGCPSDRVQSGRFGACLMAEPDLVARSVAAMREAVKIPVTVKCRIGIDGQEPQRALRDFIARVADAGCALFVVHARKAWLEGLNPKENREVPPLDYDLVYRIKQEWPALTIVVNGGIETLDDAERHLANVDGVMLGRAAYRSPAMLADIDRRFFGDARAPLDPRAAIEAFMPYIEARLAEGVPLNAMTKHVLGLFHGAPGARLFRRHLAENAARPDAGLGVLADALAHLGGARQLSAA